MSKTWVWIYANVHWIKFGICLLILAIAAMAILRQFNIKSLLNKRGIQSNIDNITLLHKRDRNIMAANRALKMLSSIARIPLFAMDDITRDYMNYNIKRAGLKGPGGLKNLSADEFKGICIVGVTLVDMLVILMIPIYGISIGVILLVAITLLGNTMPQMFIRSAVMQKDLLLKEGFPDFYLMLHYVLLTGGKAPIDRVMKSYSKITDNMEILRFIDISVDYIETYGELRAMTYIAKDYREVSEVGKLCRLIKQLFEGADIENELLGFRTELIQQKKWAIERRCEKIIKKANASFGILMIVLIQAVISAMLIYLPDISSAGGLFGM